MRCTSRRARRLRAPGLYRRNACPPPGGRNSRGPLPVSPASTGYDQRNSLQQSPQRHGDSQSIRPLRRMSWRDLDDARRHSPPAGGGLPSEPTERGQDCREGGNKEDRSALHCRREVQVLGPGGLQEDHHEREYIHCVDVVRLLSSGQQLSVQPSVGTNLPQLPARAGSGGYHASAAVALDVVVRRTSASSYCEHGHGNNSICILSTCNCDRLICAYFS